MDYDNVAFWLKIARNANPVEVPAEVSERMGLSIRISDEFPEFAGRNGGVWDICSMIKDGRKRRVKRE